MPQEQQPDDFSTIEVRVGTVPGSVNSYVLNGRRTVADALEAASLELGNREVRVNAALATTQTDLNEGDTVLLVKKIKGNL